MPIYEYRCKKCGQVFEYMQRMSDPPKRTCEACGGRSLERLISQTSFTLKGGGWYKDLYSSPKPGASSGGPEGGSGGAGGGGEGASSGSPAAGSSAAGSSGSTKTASDKKASKKKGKA